MRTDPDEATLTWEKWWYMRALQSIGGAGTIKIQNAIRDALLSIHLGKLILIVVSVQWQVETVLIAGLVLGVVTLLIRLSNQC